MATRKSNIFYHLLVFVYAAKMEFEKKAATARAGRGQVGLLALHSPAIIYKLAWGVTSLINTPKHRKKPGILISTSFCRLSHCKRRSPWPYSFGGFLDPHVANVASASWIDAPDMVHYGCHFHSRTYRRRRSRSAAGNDATWGN